jgi:hypothetical protein
MGVGKSYWYSLDYYIISIGVNIFCDSVFKTEYVTEFLVFSMFEFVY